MNLRKSLLGVSLAGVPNSWRAIRYAQARERLESQAPLPGAPPKVTMPGPLQRLEHIPAGGRFLFADAELEIVFLSADLVRVTWTPGALPVPYALARTDWPEVPVQHQASDAGHVLATDAMEVQLGSEGRLRFVTHSGQLLREDLPPERQGQTWTHRARLRPEEHLYGLGERAAGWNLRGGTYRQWNTDVGGGHQPGDDPLYLCLPVCLGLHQAGSYLVFFENPFDGGAALGAAEAPDQACMHFAGGALRYYLIPGPPAHALEVYTELTGRAPLPPRWALGFHQTCISARGEDDVRELQAGFARHELPLGTIHLDLEYMDGFRVFSLNRERFPNFEAMAGELEAGGVRLVTIVDPGVKSDPPFPVFRSGLERDVFCQQADGRPLRAPVWPGWCAFPDFTRPDTRAWWGEQYPALLNAGVAGIWHDMNEPAAFAAWGDSTLPRNTRHDLEGRGGDHLEAHNLYGLLMNQAGFDALRRLRPERRPWILTRSGWAGVQRYAWTWTGDTASVWPNVLQTVRTALGLGVSGIPYTGPDVGGFSGDPSPELYLRWLQLAAFLPFFRAHGMFHKKRTPWDFGPEVLAIVREFLQLRMRLLPYLYTLAWEAGRTGQPLARPLFWPGAAGTDPALWDVDDAFLLGDALLVAPVGAEGVRSRSVTLPPGGWYDWWDETLHAGPAAIEVAAPLERIPLLARAGSVIPAEDGECLTLNVFAPVSGEAGGQLYQDAGDGYGPSRVDRFGAERSGDGLRLRWETDGDYVFPYRALRVRIVGVRPAWLEIDLAAAGRPADLQVEVACVERPAEVRLDGQPALWHDRQGVAAISLRSASIARVALRWAA